MSSNPPEDRGSRTGDLPRRTGAELAGLVRSPRVALCGVALVGDIAAGTPLCVAGVALAARPGPD
ncbi:hypothetical protein ACFFRS_25235, partial [Saccharopolyspora hordei]|uniref:hypothetical protein n=1 Tax=Saccharopolyspora hordei TaxID=1838 RepID=UPI0035E78C90